MQVGGGRDWEAAVHLLLAMGAQQAGAPPPSAAVRRGTDEAHVLCRAAALAHAPLRRSVHGGGAGAALAGLPLGDWAGGAAPPQALCEEGDEVLDHWLDATARRAACRRIAADPPARAAAAAARLERLLRGPKGLERARAAAEAARGGWEGWGAAGGGAEYHRWCDEGVALHEPCWGAGAGEL
eukprot:TRINITY_DN14682_c0_g1_i2.p5 TRINITY_DN14682_c0_g1~~TRINITY_DN14682_c0_g1_i2.p5  ORF type:complete len:183 (+),score=68.05 TRINITY_DN14682_c0_g1_i2:929-1477(+)